MARDEQQPPEEEKAEDNFSHGLRE